MFVDSLLIPSWTILTNFVSYLLTSYAFDIDPTSQVFKNRRVFAYVDNGVPDGIQVDSEGRVYSGTGDGVQVRWTEHYHLDKLN